VLEARDWPPSAAASSSDRNNEEMFVTCCSVVAGGTTVTDGEATEGHINDVECTRSAIVFVYYVS
jgi:hypothetical protein